MPLASLDLHELSSYDPTTKSKHQNKINQNLNARLNNNNMSYTKNCKHSLIPLFLRIKNKKGITVKIMQYIFKNNAIKIMHFLDKIDECG